jgi:hypothetical protein
MMGFAAAILAVRSGRWGSRIAAMLMIMLIAIATYATITRLSFLIVGFAAFFAILFSCKRTYGRFTWFFLPLLALAAGAVLILVAPLIANNAAADVYSDESLVERFFHWGVALQTWLNSGTSIFVFGTGISQGKSPDYIVDNTFLNFAVQGGLIGLVTSVAFMYFIWMSLRTVLNERSSPAVIAICAFWATWLFTGLFNTTNAIYGLILAPLLVSYEYSDCGGLDKLRGSRPVMGAGLAERIPC